MKLAICIGGLIRGQVEDNLKRMNDVFGDLNPDYYFSHWKGDKNRNVLIPLLKDKIVNVKALYSWEEPNMHYHPFAEMSDEMAPPAIKFWLLRQNCQRRKPAGLGQAQDELAKFANGTKQILNHAMFLDKIDSSYDMVIRTRYDVKVSTKIDWKPIIEESYNEDQAIGVAIRRSRWPHFDKITKIDKVWNNPKWECGVEEPPQVVLDALKRKKMDDKTAERSHDWPCWINDPLIIHPRKLFKTEDVWQLHKDKKLLPVEYGWWQILSKPYDDGESHDCIYGGATIDRFLGIKVKGISLQ